MRTKLLRERIEKLNPVAFMGNAPKLGGCDVALGGKILPTTGIIKILFKDIIKGSAKALAAGGWENLDCGLPLWSPILHAVRKEEGVIANIVDGVLVIQNKEGSGIITTIPDSQLISLGPHNFKVVGFSDYIVSHDNINEPSKLRISPNLRGKEVLVIHRKSSLDKDVPPIILCEKGHFVPLKKLPKRPALTKA